MFFMLVLSRSWALARLVRLEHADRRGDFVELLKMVVEELDDATFLLSFRLERIKVLLKQVGDTGDWLDLSGSDPICIEDTQQRLQPMSYALRSLQCDTTSVFDHGEACPKFLLGDLVYAVARLQFGEEAHSSHVQSIGFLLRSSAHRLFPLCRLQLDGGEGRRGDGGVFGF